MHAASSSQWELQWEGNEAVLYMMLQPAVKLVYLTSADFPHMCS